MRVLNLTGYVVADAERKLSKNGKEFLTFRIVNNEFNDEKDSEGKQKPFWARVVSFNPRHFGLKPYLLKGKPVIVNGDYSVSLYQNKEGNCEISNDITANAIYFNAVGGDGQTKNNGEATTVESPVTQTKMEEPKPTTAELKVPTAAATDDDDDLPF